MDQADAPARSSGPLLEERDADIDKQENLRVRLATVTPRLGQLSQESVHRKHAKRAAVRVFT
jgi:hypothetical protein